MALGGEKKNSYRVLVKEKIVKEGELERLRRRWGDNIKIDFEGAV